MKPAQLEAPASSWWRVSPRAQAAEPDFNHDGYADLVISAHAEDVGGAQNAGLVHVIYGSSEGASATGAACTGRADQTFSIASLGLAVVAPVAPDAFGEAVAWGDFNGDGIDDLAVGAPGEDYPTGGVNIIYGSAMPQGLGYGKAGTIRRCLAPAGSSCGSNTIFLAGATLAAADFDGDGYDDLAIGSDWYSRGLVTLIYGTSSGFAARDLYMLRQGYDRPAQAGRDRGRGRGDRRCRRGRRADRQAPGRARDRHRRRRRQVPLRGRGARLRRRSWRSGSPPPARAASTSISRT